MSGGKPADLIRSVSRALRILEEVGECPGGLNAKEVALRCGIALPTAYHLLRTLCYEGYVVRRPGGRYGLGLEIAGRFRDLLGSLQRPPNIHDVLRDLAEATGHTAYFSQVVEGRIVITDLFEGPRSPHLEDLVVGFDEGAHATALGKALLSTIPLPARNSYFTEWGLRPFTGTTITDAAHLNSELATFARRGVFTEEGQYRPEVCCAAVVVGGDQGGAIGLSAGAGRWVRTSTGLLRQLAIRAADLS